jgi:hypothetical protein
MLGHDQKLGYKTFKNEEIINGIELVYLEKRPVTVSNSG